MKHIISKTIMSSLLFILMACSTEELITENVTNSSNNLRQLKETKLNIYKAWGCNTPSAQGIELAVQNTLGTMDPVPTNGYITAPYFRIKNISTGVITYKQAYNNLLSHQWQTNIPTNIAPYNTIGQYKIDLVPVIGASPAYYNIPSFYYNLYAIGSSETSCTTTTISRPIGCNYPGGPAQLFQVDNNDIFYPIPNFGFTPPAVPLFKLTRPDGMFIYTNAVIDTYGYNAWVGSFAIPTSWPLGQYKVDFVPFWGGSQTYYGIPTYYFYLTHTAGSPGANCW